MFTIGDDGVAYQTDGLRVVPISTPPVEVAISDSTPTHCFTYSDEGHQFFVIRFSDKPAWCFDIKTRRWHERGSGPTWDEWEIIATARLNGVWYGVNTLGKIYSMSRTNDDAGTVLSRMAQSTALYDGGRFITVYRLELLGEVGTADIGREIKVALQISRDGGLTWEPEVSRSFGNIGEYRQRAIWDALGWGEQMAGPIFFPDKATVRVYTHVNVEVA